MWDIIVWVVFGVIAGAIAKWIMPGTQGGGFLITAILGIIGAMIGGFIGNALFGKGVSNQIFSFYSMGMAVVGALIVLWIYGKATAKRD
ncbi:GlsB/YeaQ/YmgE family stress response membrane protein [Chryseobacterium koreense]|uniref:Transglycosylase n=1 Tax=Chryseobacterium koreense CCUG 49689 TaxID=1304281 RepID=A0A0J7IYY1_9FLAO|nr:GlsB/YeaQ/YmgE family stress response membrane protein [Chryseobacterium koreense]KMQ71031.1 hypothetical protein ACM44_08760 [Chryseobacterium koreense CCUG 49689]MBB5332887.1 putative membrane protein YeaQ/YmgE (transglycosylase-associated protein family) [Chryseobacterium koreense]